MAADQVTERIQVRHREKYDLKEKKPHGQREKQTCLRQTSSSQTSFVHYQVALRKTSPQQEQIVTSALDFHLCGILYFFLF